jgi:hypothetical protein
VKQVEACNARRNGKQVNRESKRSQRKKASLEETRQPLTTTMTALADDECNKK